MSPAAVAVELLSIAQFQEELRRVARFISAAPVGLRAAKAYAERARMSFTHKKVAVARVATSRAEQPALV